MMSDWSGSEMPTIYLDNAATSWPKPPEVGAAIELVSREAGGNPGRSAHRLSIAAARVVEHGREAVAGLLNAEDPGRIVFTHNATHALNVALYSLVGPGDHVVTTSVEHNSVMRPLRHLESQGVALTVVPCQPDGTLDPARVRDAYRSNTRLLVTAHGSNVTGTLLPIGTLAIDARARGVLYLVDASQTAGAVPINVRQDRIDLLAFTGHKALLGPTGTGGLYVRDGVTLTPLIRGGTGSDSARETQPEFLPDMLESGTPNVAGIAGLAAAIGVLSDVGIETVRAHERALVARFIAAASEIPHVTVYGVGDAAARCGVISFNVAGSTPAEVAVVLDDSFGIMARAGLHCAPAAHRTLGTFPGGTVRFSVGWFNTSADIDAALDALREIAAWAAAPRQPLAEPWTA